MPFQPVEWPERRDAKPESRGLERGGTSFLFTGDLEATGESDVLSTLADSASELLDVDILKVAHHGSKTSSSDAFLNAVTPQVAVISVGEGSRDGLPDQETLDALAAVGAEIYRTDHHGTVIVWTDGWQYTVTDGMCIPSSLLYMKQGPLALGKHCDPV